MTLPAEHGHHRVMVSRMQSGDLLRALWALAVSRGVDVFYKSPDPPGSRSAAGFAVSHYGGPPAIHLCRWPVPMPEDQPDVGTQPDVDLLLLAHEFGHFMSWKGATRSEAYEAALAKWHSYQLLDAPEAVLILDEERRAWDLAEQALRGLALLDWSTFRVGADEALRVYEVALAGIYPG